eukprot:gnl/TRDRNA2_/TRDRNA2_137952_c0_seq1.p1 gnl/TRDRNA2_/TRDRNA2_137952_c0~~gnl/TRDRNA2_/TRDRNA2_137952_c0_seq1.p1  ORF type:complete len:402 (-),score=87.76 gnl/TRDRNA2_/TRDRNA2_137952_c0_seq1:147-1247(-)
MSSDETYEVHRACGQHRVPCVEANLGQQAEFTSKIIDVIHGHHIHFRLSPAVWRLVAKGAPSTGTVPTSVSQHKSPKGTFWVLMPMAGGPQDMAIDDRKKDGTYEIPRSCISQLWCSKGEHRGHVLSFVFSGGEVLTANPSLVTCLKMQHRAAPTERNVVSALLIGIGNNKERKNDPTLMIDEGCVLLGDVEKFATEHTKDRIDRRNTVIVDLQLGGEDAAYPRLVAYADSCRPADPNENRDVIFLMRQVGGRDFPKGFREDLVKALSSPKGGKPPVVKMSLPVLAVNVATSILAHYWETRSLIPGLGLPSRTGVSAANAQKGAADAAPRAKAKAVPAGSCRWRVLERKPNEAAAEGAEAGPGEED